ncbi:hypothetical protein [Microbacterium terrisoli]|uniref:hypothetical protein n=1 Tax=Microbacterium terrisoli TaxID=3242192 RepID=UPI0028050F29|nr:hypothetical protein [Microbacterium protaetiae]
MKRIIALGIALVVATTLTGCGAVSAVSSPDHTASDAPNVVYPDGYGPDATTEPADPEPTDPESADPEPSTPEAGSLENPFPAGYTATISQNDEDYYTVTFTLVAADGDKKIAAANQFNDRPPHGYHYVIVKATFTGLSSEAVDPGVEMFDWQVADQDGNLYQSASVVTDEESLSGSPSLYKGQKFTGVEVYTVPDSTTTLYMSALGSYLAL